MHMRRTYRSSNVRFCMEDENQRRTWEYLQGLDRKDGSYGKILSDAFVQVLDYQILEDNAENKNRGDRLQQLVQTIDHDTNVRREQWTAENNFHEQMETVVERMEESLAERFIRLQDALIEQVMKQLSEYTLSTVSDEERGLVEPYKDETEQVPDIVMSDAMMSMALAMGE